jgi:hypothetical protein
MAGVCRASGRVLEPQVGLSILGGKSLTARHLFEALGFADEPQLVV